MQIGALNACQALVFEVDKRNLFAFESLLQTFLPCKLSANFSVNTRLKDEFSTNYPFRREK